MKTSGWSSFAYVYCWFSYAAAQLELHQVSVNEPPRDKTNNLHMRKQTVTAKLISAFVFASRIVQFLSFLNPKFPASSHILCLYSLVNVGPIQKLDCWFSHEAAQKFQ